MNDPVWTHGNQSETHAKRFAGNAENFAFDGKNSAGFCGFYQEANYDDRFFPENSK